MSSKKKSRAAPWRVTSTTFPGAERNSSSPRSEWHPRRNNESNERSSVLDVTLSPAVVSEKKKQLPSNFSSQTRTYTLRFTTKQRSTHHSSPEKTIAKKKKSFKNAWSVAAVVKGKGQSLQEGSIRFHWPISRRRRRRIKPNGPHTGHVIIAPTDTSSSSRKRPFPSPSSSSSSRSPFPRRLLAGSFACQKYFERTEKKGRRWTRGRAKGVQRERERERLSQGNSSPEMKFNGADDQQQPPSSPGPEKGGWGRAGGALARGWRRTSSLLPSRMISSLKIQSTPELKRREHYGNQRVRIRQMQIQMSLTTIIRHIWRWKGDGQQLFTASHAYLGYLAVVSTSHSSSQGHKLLLLLPRSSSPPPAGWRSAEGGTARDDPWKGALN